MGEWEACEGRGAILWPDVAAQRLQRLNPAQPIRQEKQANQTEQQPLGNLCFLHPAFQIASILLSDIELGPCRALKVHS